MRRSIWVRLMAVLLVVCMVAPTAMAAPRGSVGSSGGWFERWFGKGWPGSTETTEPTEQTESTEQTEATQATEDTGSSDAELVLLEDETTVENGDMLRASTYALNKDTGVTPLAEGDSYTSVAMTYQELYTNYEKTTYYYLRNGTYYKITKMDIDSNNRYRVYSSDYDNGQSRLVRGYSDDTITVYTLDSGSTSTTKTIKYFPVTMYNYDAATINAATAKVDGNTGMGIYFNDGNPSSKTGSDGGSGSAWNYWNKNTGNNNYGQYTYSGLVESSLTANKDITFTKPDGGIFNSDATVKTIYTGVEMPFVYENGTYTFDASQNGVYFYADSTQGSTTAQSNGRLYFAEGDTQGWTGMNYGDGSKNLWAPFNEDNLTGEGSVDYHFGMRTTIPFTMTANGRMNPNENDSQAITFSFSGDDDVWIFIDGQLVIDLGGIHNRLDASIDFAANTVTYTVSNKALASLGDAADLLFKSDDGWTSEMGTLTNSDGNSGTFIVKYTHKLFNDDNGSGIVNQTRETFAATDSHELTIFYLERGAGSSNCKIQFNLPMKDVVSVTKRATQSISSDGTLSPLTAKEQETVNNIDFGFTLIKNGTPVANTNYSLLNANGQVISTPSTDANGHFTLRNGQTAKFVGEIAADGAEYQVVEDAVEGIGFKLPTYTYSGTAAGGYTVSGTSYSESSAIPATKENLTSAAVTAKGSTEAEDSLQFICENYFDANLPNPSSRPVDDQIVIDYGLSVVIDALANDVYRGDTIELTDVTGAQYGDATIENGKITYQLTNQLTGVEVLTYTAKVTGSGNSGNETTTASESKTAKIYIIPATSMYYEENFTGLVTFTNGTIANEDGTTTTTVSEWKAEGTAQTDPQEPGVVGTVGDSPYGSDAAYLNDSGDSNGTSKYVDTTDGAASFSYTFTGTGTSFFARTGSTAAYMQVIVTDSTGKEVDNLRRNNIYEATDGTNVGTLYNIPVYTFDGQDYDTYTVTVTVMKAKESLNRGKDFYLDGIRVINPLDSTDANASVANAAYATDGEANMTVATLRNKLIGEAQINDDDTISWNEGDNFVLFTDTNGKITSAEEYKSNGPKEEVYLNNGQSVTFSLIDWDANTNKIYLGIKAPVGSGTVSINGNTLNINNATDCYYDISGYANITTDKDGVKTATFEVKATSNLISVTNIKVTGNVQFTIVNQVDEDYEGSGNEEEET